MLVGVIALILLGYGWWLLAPRKMAPPDVEIEATALNVSTASGKEAEDLAHMPLFDPAAGDWIVAGRHQRSIIALTPPRDQDPLGDPHGIGRGISVRLPEGAGQDVMQAAMRALASEGICTAALFIGGMRRDGGEVATAPVIKIRRLADGHGGTSPCRDRLNQATSAPSRLDRRDV